MPNLFNKFLNFRRLGLWQRKKNQVVGLDIGSASIKVVQIKREQGKAILETYGEIANGPYRNLAVGQAAILPAETLVGAIKDIFQEANITTNLVGISLPVRSSLLVIIDIPRVGKEMLPKVVPIEARKYIPVPISEVTLDWWVIPKQDFSENEKKKTTLSVLVVAVHNNVIREYQEVLGTAGLNTAFFEIETFSALRSVLGGELSSTAILDLGASTSKVAIVDYGIVRVSHIIDKGAQNITVALSRALSIDFAKAEEIKRRVGLVERFVDGKEISTTVSGLVEHIFAESNKIITTYQTKSRRSVNKLILIGGGALLRGLPELAAKSFEMPVELGQPFDKVEAPVFLEGMLRTAGASFSVALGSALRYLQTLE